MNTFLITMAVIHLLVAGARLASKPGESRGFNPGAGALLSSAPSTWAWPSGR